MGTIMRFLCLPYNFTILLWELDAKLVLYRQCTHSVFAQKPFKNHRQSFHINDAKNISFAAHNLMVNFHFSAFRLWFYTQCGFYVSTLNGDCLHKHTHTRTIGHTVSYFSLLFSYGANAILTVRQMCTLFHTCVFISIFTFNISSLI